MRRAWFAAVPLVAVTLLIAAGSGAMSQAQRAAQAPQPGGPPQGRQAPPPQQQMPQEPAITPKPYEPVTVTAPQPHADPSFEAFRKQLEAVASRKDRAALARMVVAKGFFWESETGNRADRSKSGIDNLTAALELNNRDGGGWEALEGFASDPTASPMRGRANTICGPADPQFDLKRFEDMVKATGSDEADWGVPVQPGLEVRAAAQANAPVIEKLGMHFVWVWIDLSPAAQQSEMLRVVTPSGKVGYVPADSLSPIGSDQVCYVKEASGWKIAGLIGQ